MQAACRGVRIERPSQWARGNPSRIERLIIEGYHLRAAWRHSDTRGEPMKTLLILRHGKAQPDTPAGGDRVRKLTKRGRRDAAAMGAHILASTGTPDAIITSDAMRARQTAQLAAEALAFSQPLTVEPSVYAADLSDLLAVVRAISDDVDTALLVGHNPGFEELTAALAGEDEEVTLPTAALARVDLDVARWDGVTNGTGVLRGITTPRSLP
jgi:phosphohistidine phosphatase